MFSISLVLDGEAHIKPARCEDYTIGACEVAPDGSKNLVYDEALDDIRSLLSDACEILEESQALAFHVEGFGQSDWPVDVSIDLLTIIEQLPALFSWLDSEDAGEFQLDFYEQGMERSLIFKRMNTDVQVTCISGTKWPPVPEDEGIGLPHLDYMFGELVRTFVRSVKRICPDVAGHEWFQAWCRQENLLKRLDAN